MVELIGDNRILWTQYRFIQTRIGVKARRVQNGVLHTQEATYPLLQGFMNFLRAADKPH